MSDVQHSGAIRMPILASGDMKVTHMATVRASAEILERAKTKDRPEKDYGTVTKVEVNFAMDDPKFELDNALMEYIASVHRQLEEACQGEIRRRAISTSLNDEPTF